VTILDTSGAPDADLYRRLFLLTTVSGLAAIVIGTRLRSIRAPAPVPALAG
jgi:hypothetical protein